ncbi:MAG: preprotein translocase subunit YajC, partial [Planctomycetota bacterium]
TSSRAQKKERKKKEEMLSTVAKHDKVVLGSGIIGTVAEVRSDEVVLKIDNNTGARLTVQKAAVSSILKKHGQASNQEEEQSFGDEQLEAELETADQR